MRKYWYRRILIMIATFTVAVGGSYYPWQYDNETGNGQDGYAGAFGNAIGKLQIVIE